MFKKTAQAVIAEPILKPDDWEKMWGKSAFRGCELDKDHKFCKTASLQKMAASSKYLLSHCTIMSSVMCENPPEDWLIKPECSHLVNNNDDAWENGVLKLSYRTFVGAFNFEEHDQNSKRARGHILDSVLRKIHLTPEVWVYYCDILVATDLAHEKLVEDIRNDKMRYMSMGCTTSLVTCSYCGQKVADSSDFCPHLQYQKGTFLTDENGIPRRIAELCGDTSLPNGGVMFVEASWVKIPAAPLAVKRNIITEEWEGPKTPYSKAASEKSKISKIASSNLSETLLNADFQGNSRR